MAEQNTDHTVVTETGSPYLPLKTPHSIRLLRTLPKPNTPDDIHCTIQEYDRSTEDCPRYTALSYAWGNQNVQRPILINGKTRWVTLNLFEALLRLRHRRPGIYIWIDALCIDQENPAERGHQVAQMRAIYSKAERVISWLGPAGGDIAHLFDIMRRYHRMCTPDAIVHGNGVSFYDEVIDQALRYIIELAYWTRIWIVQEIVVAPSLTLMCGDNTVPWRVFANFVKRAYYGHFYYKHSLDARDRHSIRIHESPRIIRLLHWRHKDVTLADALAWTAGSHATDIRDRIYAVLGLVSTGEHIEADYTLSSCAVFSRAIQVLFADLPADLHEEARDLGLNWNWDWLDIKRDATSEERGDLKKFQRTKEESADASSKTILHKSARALAISYGCEDTAQLASILFPNYKIWRKRKSADGDATLMDQDPPCDGKFCASNYVLDQMIRLSRAGRATRESKHVS